MKKVTLTAVIIVLSVICLGQVPEYFNYQVIVRDGSTNNPLTNQDVSFRMSILKGSISGESQYSELNSANTGALGIVNLVIGNGTGKTGDITTIDWGADSYFLKVEIDKTGGSAYLEMGTTQLLSVPYAMHSKTATSYAETQNLFNVLTQGTDAGNNKIVNVSQQGIGTAIPNSSAALEISSISQGFLPPRMNYDQKMDISSPGTGLMIWCNNCGTSGELQIYNGTTWTNLIGGIGSPSFALLGPTTEITLITATSATSGGNITDDGGATVTARGVCWSTSANPTIANSKTMDGSGTGEFTSSITGLDPLTTYYLRAYATNTMGNSYGNEISFTTTSPTAPILATLEANSIDGTSAISGGIVTSDGGADLTARGVCWSTSANPTIANSKTMDGSGTGEFTSSITGLTLNTIYYVRAYATNSEGTTYGNEISFRTGIGLIGDSYLGGKIAYFLQPGDPGYNINISHGLIAAPSDQSIGIKWFNDLQSELHETGKEIGTGMTNTNNIVSIEGDGSYAAKLCYDLDLNGYSDWYLPSIDELGKLYINRVKIGGTDSETDYIYYWSSSQFDAMDAWCFEFADNLVDLPTIGQTYEVYYVRAIRSF